MRAVWAAVLLGSLVIPTVTRSQEQSPEFAALLPLVRQRAAAGDAVAQYELATAYAAGRIIQYGRAAAMQWYRRSAEAGYAPAQYRLATLLTWEQAAEQRQWIERAAAQDYAPALTWKSGLFGDQFRYDKPAADAARDMALVLRAADLGDVHAQAAASKAYRMGLYGLPRDPGRALYWQDRRNNYLRDHAAVVAAAEPADASEVSREAANVAKFVAAAQKDTTALASQAALIARDAARFREGASRGDIQSKFELGVMTIAGRGVPRDIAAGRAMVLQAAEQGHERAGWYLHVLASGRAKDFPAVDVAEMVRWGAMVKSRGGEPFVQDFEARHPTVAKATSFMFAKAVTASAQSGVATVVEPARKAVALGPRVALVIGNGGYTGELGGLANAVADARLMASSLRQAGFDVELVTDADQRGMKEAIRRLGQRLTAAGSAATGLFYYAGHGAQSEGVNYLAPIGAPLKSEADLELDAIPANSVLAQMDRSGATTSIVILDACRNMPLARKTRDGTRGLARMERGRGAFIAYAAAPGETASDGSNGNSPFTRALAAELLRPGQPIDIMFRRVRASVVEATAGRQTPWDSSSLVSDFAFVP